MALRSLLQATLVVTLAAQRVAADCVAFGVDFQDGGVYFQNSLSTDPFTFVSQYEGCQNDTAYNILIDPNGDQYLCSDTDLQPDDTDQMSTCPEDKDQLFSGDWTIVVMSNNGNGDPLNVQRDFSLNVGPQQTTTTTPTVTYSTTTVPLTSTTSTTTFTSTVVASTPTTTVPSTTITRTYKVTPSRVTLKTTSVLYTTTKVKAKVSVVKTTSYVTPSCHLPTIATTTDKTCNIQITVASISTPTPAKLRFARDAEGSLLDKEAFIKQRREYLAARHALAKRAPDVETVTVTDTNTSDYPTTTLIVTEPTVTATFVETATTTSTSTPSTVTIVKGKTTAPAVTSTLPTPTRTVVKYTIVSTTVSTTYSPTVTIYKKTTPASLKASCRSAGGILF